MATLALSAVGAQLIPTAATIGGTKIVLGAALGSVLGAIVDQKLLFGNDTPKFPTQKVDDLQLGGASAGRPLPIVVGRRARVPGTYIYISELKKSDSSIDVGGKGGGTTLSKSTFKIDAAVAFCQGEADNVSRIYADSKLIYTEAPELITVTETSDEISFVPIMGTFPTQSHAKLVAASGSINLTLLFQTGLSITVSGASNPSNNGTFTVYAIQTQSDGDTELLIDFPDNFVLESAGASVTLTQSYSGLAPYVADSVTIYKSGTGNTRDSFLQGIFGTEIPAFRDTVYAVFQNINLTFRFGNRAPSFEALIVQNDIETVQGAISRVLTFYGGLSPSDQEIDDWDDGMGGDVPFEGLKIVGPTSCAELLAPIVLAHDGVVREASGKIEVKRRTNLPTVTLTEAELGAGPRGSTPKLPAEQGRPSKRDLLRSVAVHYSDPAVEWAGNEQEYAAPGAEDEQTDIADISSLTLESGFAAGVARRMLWEARVNARKVGEIRLAPARMLIQEGDRILIPASYVQPAGGYIRMLSQTVDVGRDWTVQVRGSAEDPASTQIEGVTGAEPPEQNPGMYVPPNMRRYVVELPPLSTAQGAAFAPILTCAGAAANIQETYIGGQWWWTTDVQQLVWSTFSDYPNEAVIGVTETALPEPPNGNWSVFDNVSTVDVRLFEGTLSSTDEAGVLNGENWCLLFAEVVGFTTATLVGGNTWRLSGLLRGRVDTQDSMASHDVDQRFILLTDPNVLFQGFGAFDLGATRKFELVATGGAAPTDGLEKVLNGRTIRPFSPSQLRGIRQTNGDLVIAWTRRTRAPMALLTGQVAPLAQLEEKYEVEILDAPGGNVLRTFTTGSQSVTYSAILQLFDGYTPTVDPIPAVVYQVDDTIGIGRSKPTAGYVF